MNKTAIYLIFVITLMSLMLSPMSQGLNNANTTVAISGNIIHVVYYVTATNDQNSIISPNGITAVSAGSSQTYSITASEGHSISRVLVDGLNQGPITSYTFSAITNNHTIAVFSENTETTELKKAIVIYGTETLTATQQADVANNFDLLIAGMDMTQATLAGIKTLNPNILIFVYMDTIATSSSDSSSVYWDTANSHEDWFIHDNAGNRVRNGIWNGWYLMDLTSGWRDFYSQHSNTLVNSPYVDGIFGDDVVNEIQWTIAAGVFYDAVTGSTLTTSDFSSSFLNNWKTNMVSFLNYVDNHMIANKKFVINSEERDTNVYLTNTSVDGKMAENFAVDGSFSESRLFVSIDGMVRDSALGRIVISENYAGTDPNSRSAKYCYVATLLGMNGDNCYFGYNYGAYYGYDQGAHHMPTMVTNLGSPSGSYYKSQSVYMRTYTNGIVLLNPSANTYTINLGNNYQLPDGTKVSSIILNPWSGEILLSQT